MRCVIFSLLLLFSATCFADELPVVRFPTKKEIEKAEIKNLIKALDESNKADKAKKEKQESLQSDDSQNFLPRQNHPSSSKYYFKKNKSRLLCPT